MRQRNEKFAKTSLIFMNFLTSIAIAAISPALPAIQAFFSDQPLDQIKLVITTPAIVFIFFSILTMFVKKYKSQVQAYIFGLIIYTIAGVGCFFTIDFTILIICRIFVGVGIGLFVPISFSLIKQLFPDESAKLLGLSISFASLGAALSAIAAGFLAKIAWNYTFLLYLLGIPFIIISIFGMTPGMGREKIFDKNRDLGKSSKDSGDKIGFGRAILLILFNLTNYTFYFFYIIHLGFFMAEQSIGDTALTGIVQATSTLSAFIAGMIFSISTPKIQKRLAVCLSLTFPFGYLIIGNAQVTYQMILAGVFLGFPNGYVTPLIADMSTIGYSQKKQPAIMALIGATTFLGQFLASWLGSGIQAIFSITRFDVMFRIMFWLVFPIYVIFWVTIGLMFRIKKKN